MHGINIGVGRARSVRKNSPPVEYNFLATTLPAGFTFTRASIATDVINGVLTEFASGQARISTYNGYLAETARTNSLRNGQAGGSVAGVLGGGGSLPTNWNDINTVGLTREIVGSGTINGFSYIDLKLSGTPSAGTYELLFDAATQVTAASGQVWSGSFYIGLIAGSLTGITSVNARVSGRLSGAETEGTSQSIVPTIDPTRVFAIRNLNGGTTNRVIAELTAVVTAVPVNATFRIAACQLEQGYGATSYIPTTTAVATRAKDVLYIPKASIPGFSNTNGTIVASCRSARFFYSGVDGQTIIHLGDNGGDFLELAKFAYASGRIQARVLKGYSQLGATNAFPAIGLGEDFKVAGTYQGNRIALAVKGGDAQSTSLTDLPNFVSLYVGNDTYSALMGYIKRIDYYNTSKSDAELKVLSA